MADAPNGVVYLLMTDQTTSVSSTFLGRLRRDTRGNTLAIMAAAMIPMIGFAGSAVDMSRLYVIKVRLQQACDAGVLAGRKAMDDTKMSTPIEQDAQDQAQTFFKNNLREGWFQTQTASLVTKKASLSTDPTVANAMSGVATVTVPMSVMSFFGFKSQQLTLTCQAVFDVADSDVMFVLDTTGSMSCIPGAAPTCANGMKTYQRSDGTTGYYNEESSGSKLEALRQSVLKFDETMRANVDKTTHFRYGFVTYSSSVNVGFSLPSQNLVTSSAMYESRRVYDDYNYKDPFAASLTGVPQNLCVAQRLPATGYVRSYQGVWTDEGYYQARKFYNLSWTSANGGTCSGTAQRLRAMWRYESIDLPLTAWSAKQMVTLPGRLDGLQSKWRGCIEELGTITGSSFDVNNLPDDLDPDIKNVQWPPQYADAYWQRNSSAVQDVKDESVNEDSWNAWTDMSYRQTGGMAQSGAVACGKEAMRLTDMTDASKAQTIKDYLYSTEFKPLGGTYHDVGMIWGVRMISPGGIFADDTKAWPGRKEPARNIVFMTDGTMAPNQYSYSLWGTERLENRTGGGSDSATDYKNHVARFRVECDAAKQRGITIYVVELVDPAAKDNADMVYCSAPGQYFKVDTAKKLDSAFKTIAQRIAMLRISQ